MCAAAAASARVIAARIASESSHSWSPISRSSLYAACGPINGHVNSHDGGHVNGHGSSKRLQFDPKTLSGTLL